MTERLTELAEKTDKIRIVYVFSDEKVEKWELGFITKSLIEKYAPTTKYSVFVNGSVSLYNRTTPQIADLKLEKKYVIWYN